jgi:glycine/D-amino acid oxidase-like deaminating enzyme
LSAVSDVVVVGAGIVGTAVARELAVRGVPVTLVDRGEVSSGTTGLGEGNVLAADKDTGPSSTSRVAGLAVYDELEARLGDDARIRRKGALVVHREADTWAAEPARAARLGVPARAGHPEELQRLEPALTGAAYGATLVPGRSAVRRASGRARAGARGRRGGGGGAHRRGGRGVDVSGGRVRGVRTAAGRMAAGAVVLAAGAWTAPLAASAGVPLPLEPRKGQLVRLRRAGPALRRPQGDRGLLSRRRPQRRARLQLSAVVETTWEGDVLVGSSRERRGFDTAVDPAVSDAMIERAARLFPALRALDRLDAWAGLRPWLPGGLPAIGPSDAVPGVWLATGHEGAGVALGPVTGRLVAQLYCGEPPVVDPAPFAPDRFAEAAV